MRSTNSDRTPSLHPLKSLLECVVGPLRRSVIALADGALAALCPTHKSDAAWKSQPSHDHPLTWRQGWPRF